MRNLSSVFVLVINVMLLINWAHAGVSREQMEKMGNGLRTSCINKVGADLGNVQEIRKGIFIDDPLNKCYTKCVMGLMRTLTKSGSIDIEMMVKQIGVMASAEIADALVEISRNCHAQMTATDPCELAWQFTMCLHRGNPDIFFFP